MFLKDKQASSFKIRNLSKHTVAFLHPFSLRFPCLVHLTCTAVTVDSTSMGSPKPETSHSIYLAMNKVQMNNDSTRSKLRCFWRQLNRQPCCPFPVFEIAATIAGLLVRLNHAFGIYTIIIVQGGHGKC